jgi:hypothetical protein
MRGKDLSNPALDAHRMIFDVFRRGKELSVTAMKAGQGWWLATLEARSAEERAQATWERQCMREWRDVV